MATPNNGCEEQELFTEVMSRDFLNFSFRSSSSYADQLARATEKTGQLCAVTVRTRVLPSKQKVVWMSHNFGFMGGSLGCAEGEKLVRGFEYAREHKLPVIIQCRSGGARMQEGTLSLMQMAKVSVAVGAHRASKLPFITVLLDPTYGGVSASYAMQSDVRISVSDARIGFAGPAVILNTMYEMNQEKYDEACPSAFQSAQYLEAHGQLDVVLPAAKGPQLDASVDAAVGDVLRVLTKQGASTPGSVPRDLVKPSDSDTVMDYTRSRDMTRPQAQDVISKIFTGYVELEGDGRIGSDRCIRGGLGMLRDVPCVVVATCKGHTPSKMKEANFGMPSPHGYRKAMRLMQLAERFSLPVVTFIDTCGALPSFSAEEQGQSEAIATNLVVMGMLNTPIVTVVLGEGGSGGALGIGMGDRIAMLSGAYYGVISPEGASSILGRYKSNEDKAKQFPIDCKNLATAQSIYAPQLKELGVIDEVLWETGDRRKETFKDFPLLQSDIESFLLTSLADLTKLTPDSLVQSRYNRFRNMGIYGLWDPTMEQVHVDPATPMGEQSPVSVSQRATAHMPRYAVLPSPKEAPAAKPPATKPKESRLLRHLADETVRGSRSAFRKLWPFTSGDVPPPAVDALANPPPAAAKDPLYAKKILDEQGPEALAAWVRKESRVLITDTTMRDAHQSLLATRVRTTDILAAAHEAQRVMGGKAGVFSFEMWGGATFDVAYRFLHECPWERLRILRKAMPDVCFQMLIRGANAVGYKSYPDNTIAEFCRLAAENGMDVFRIFDCFNDVSQMRVCIDAVRKAKKVAEVCICFTGDFLQKGEKIYTLDYYRNLAREVKEAGAHMIGLKDMAGLLKPAAAAPLMKALREGAGDDIPIHFHTHATSSISLATVLAMSAAGCDVVDTCIASMADGTSQPSLNAFLADLETSENTRYPGVPYLSLERLDMFWARIRTLYCPFESGMLSGTARVYDHQIPGGQYSNLLVQCKSMGLAPRWAEVCDMYRDVNKLFGDVVKVTPSSKCIGDMALYLVQRQMTVEDVITRGDKIDFPQSVIDMMAGRLGYPHRGFPENVQKIILKDTQPLPRGSRPGDSLPPDDFEKEKARLTERLHREATMEEVISSLLYPKVFSDFLDYIDTTTSAVTALPSKVFWYGMQVGETIELKDLKDDAVQDLLADAAPDVREAKITLSRVGPTGTDGTRDVHFLVNGSIAHVVKVKDASAEAQASGPKADPDDAKQIGSPMSGNIEAFLVKQGDTVTKGQKIAIVGAMKMEVEACAPFDGKVEKVLVAKGDKVDEGSLIAIVAPAS